MGKLILITGATRGLGWALVKEFVGRGHRVVGCGRNSEKIKKLSSLYPSPHQFSVVDVSSDPQVARWIQALPQEEGVPDLVLNNAALMNHPAPLWKIAAQEFDRMMAVNLGGVANVIRHVVPLFLQRGQGIIVNFSSGWGRSTAAEVAPYCTSKWGIEGLTQSLAQELPKGLAAVALNPGVIDTEMLRQCWSAGAQGYPPPEQWAPRAADFLLKLSAKDNGKSLSIS